MMPGIFGNICRGWDEGRLFPRHTGLCHVPESRRGGGLRSRSASCLTKKNYLSRTHILSTLSRVRATPCRTLATLTSLSSLTALKSMKSTTENKKLPIWQLCYHCCWYVICHSHNLRCHQWWQVCQIDHRFFSVTYFTAFYDWAICIRNFPLHCKSYFYMVCSFVYLFFAAWTILQDLINYTVIMNRETALRLYFALGFQYKEILIMLEKINNYSISMRTLKRKLRHLNLKRRDNYSDLIEVCLFLQDQVLGSGSMLGYKTMHLKCLHNGYTVTQETVRLLLHVIDPDGVSRRKRRRLTRRVYLNMGPNFTWHIDSYDKLKPYGICINGAIDGFSRYVLWLEAWHTNSDPRLIAGYFMNSVRSLQGCPTRMRADPGTENGHVRDMLKFLRTAHGDRYADNCYIEGSSHHNQRIEMWWGILRRQCIQYWMDYFGIMKDMGIYTGNILDKALLQFCFMKLVQVRNGCFREQM